MEKADIEKKVKMVTGKLGKELHQIIMNMYTNLFKGVQKMDPELVFEKLYTKCDGSKGHWQIPLDEESIRLATFNKQVERYQFRRLPYGVKDVFHNRIRDHPLSTYLTMAEGSFKMCTVAYRKRERCHTTSVCTHLHYLFSSFWQHVCLF